MNETRSRLALGAKGLRRTRRSVDNSTGRRLNQGRVEAMIRFCRRWMEKAGRCDDSQLDGVFDRFFSLFVAFNRLYSHTAYSLGNPGADDRKAATRLFPQAVGHQVLHAALVSCDRNDIDLLRDLIGPGGTFYVISNRGYGGPNIRRNRQLCESLGSEDPRTVVEAVLDYLYALRCNMFHGSKDFDVHQITIIRPASRCLERVLEAGLTRASSSAV